ncbi:MAG: hypothetical protein OHK0017_10910 [Patescibacteria group bacterium]
MPVSAQYGGSSGTTGTVTTSVSGNVLTINLANVSGGDTVTLTNLTIPGLTGLEFKFSGNVASGSIVFTPLTSSTLAANLPNSFIAGYSMTVNGFSASLISSVKLTVSVANTVLANYDTSTIKAYSSASPWAVTGLASLGTANGSTSYAITTAGAFNQVALSGVLTSDLPRTGAESLTTTGVIGALVILISYFLVQSLNTKKARR